eukprot:TRINITY_DN2192_c1_g1_i1.p1 TRINITY_DN2192_c1_g1~~TRINITY_DN2192_c1_g1_i1.p1  ORF type:complete len:520 (+),score=84.62 TRINITY_DN2192_c1_g1_i1:86-1645(+)
MDVDAHAPEDDTGLHLELDRDEVSCESTGASWGLSDKPSHSALRQPGCASGARAHLRTPEHGDISMLPSALRRRRASFDGDATMVAESGTPTAALRRGRATPPSRASTQSAGNSEIGDDEDDTMAEHRSMQRSERPRMRCKRKRDCALTSVVDRFGSMQLHAADGAPLAAGQTRGRSGCRTVSPSGTLRSKSILKKTHSGSRVRFARQGRAMKDFVMFDEANIKEVQTCLASLSDSKPAPTISSVPLLPPVPGTPRAVLLFQQAEESGGEGGAVQSAVPVRDPGGDDAAATSWSPPPPQKVSPSTPIQLVSSSGSSPVSPSCAQAEAGDQSWMHVDASAGERSGGEQAKPAKRGPNFYKTRQRRVRQQEIEEGISFKRLLGQQSALDDDDGQGPRSPISSDFVFSIGRSIQSGRGFSPPGRGVMCVRAGQQQQQQPVIESADVPKTPPAETAQPNVHTQASPPRAVGDGWSAPPAAQVAQPFRFAEPAAARVPVTLPAQSAGFQFPEATGPPQNFSFVS